MIYTLLSYPTLSDFLLRALGIDIPLPIHTYGLFIAIAFCFGIYIVSQEFKRKEKQGLLFQLERKTIVGKKLTTFEIIYTTIITFLILYKLVYCFGNYEDFSRAPHKFLGNLEGNFTIGLLGTIGFMIYYIYKRKKEELPKPKEVIEKIWPHDLAGNMLMVTSFFGLLGAKIFHCLENMDEFLANPVEMFFSFSGLTFFGGLIIGGLAGYIFLKKNQINPFVFLDATAPAIAVAYGLGRLGCQISGDGCWGIVNESACPGWLPQWAWSSNFEHNVINSGEMMADCSGRFCHQLTQSVYPTSLYESIMMFIIAGILFLLSRKVFKIPGQVIAAYLFFQGVERMLIEQIRVNNKFNLLGMEVTQAEIIATILITLGIASMIFIYKFKDYIIEYCKKKPVLK